MGHLKLAGIRKAYGETTVVDNLDVEVRDGEFLVLVGPSGCGKSTTLRMIAGLEHITAGHLLLNGEEMNEVHASKRNMAMVFQNYALFPHMSVFENMAFGLRVRKVPRREIEKKVGEAAEILNLTPLLKRKPGELSGGQNQRVALGRALVREPAVFLMDEPLSNLDAKLRSRMRTEIKELQQRLKATMIYVTHDQVEAMTMGDKIAVMKEGRIQQFGSPIDLYNRPANRFVGEFIGAPPMNFAEGVLEERDGKLLLSMDGDALEITEDTPAYAMRSQLGQSIIMGIRAEHLALCAEREINSLAFEVRHTELLGSETLLFVTRRNLQWTVKLQGQHMANRGDVVHLACQANQLHWFDCFTQNRWKEKN